LPPGGEAVNLLAMMEQPAPPAASYAVEAGNRFPSPEDGGGGGGAAGSGAAAAGASGAAAGTAAGAGAAPGSGAGGVGAGTSGGTGTGAGSGRGAGPGGGTAGEGSGSGTSGPGAGAGRPGQGSGSGRGSGAGLGGRGSGTGTGAGTGAGGTGTGSGSRPGGRGAAIEVGGLSIAGGAVAIRTESPNTSTFDVVVVSQNSREILPESAGVLTGEPVYTVYLSVPGSRREWILQFAVPNSREPVRQRTANSIQLGSATPVRAPYPLRKANLQLGEEAAGAQGRVVIYGNITAKGSVEDLRVIRSVRSEVDLAVMACLRQFQFRPAVRDGVPVLVEALFGVPLN
jgi:TonB family protein